MQEISSNKSKKKRDQKLNILVLQTVTVGVILLFAVGIRLFGGDVYQKLSALYHEKFDDITRTAEVLEPQNNVSDTSSENAVSDNASSDASLPSDSEPQSSAEQSGEEYDAEIDGDLSGNIVDYDAMQSTTVATGINTLQWPISGTITSHYGYRTNPITGKYTMHNGLDISAVTGTEIASAYDGVVTSAGHSESYGYYIIVTHAGNLQTLYAHCSKLLADEGDTVKKGDTVALVGSTGRSTGPHLHFEVRVNSYRIDPEWLLSEIRDV